MFYDHVWSHTERKLLEAALPLVARAGAHAMSFQDLARPVHITKPSVHYHFPTNSDLLIALIDGYEATLSEQLRSILRSKYSGDNKLRLYLGELANLVGAYDGKQICPCAMLSAEVESLKPEVAKRVTSFFKDRAKALASILEEGRDDGSLRFRGPAEPMAWTILSFVQGAMLLARATDGDELFCKMQTAFEWLLVVPGAERPPNPNGETAGEDSMTNEGAVVFRHAPVADTTCEMPSASIQEAKPPTSPGPIVCLKELPADASDTGASLSRDGL